MPAAAWFRCRWPTKGSEHRCPHDSSGAIPVHKLSLNRCRATLATPSAAAPWNTKPQSAQRAMWIVTRWFLMISRSPIPYPHAAPRRTIRVGTRGTVSKISEEQLFYLMSRGLTGKRQPKWSSWDLLNRSLENCRWNMLSNLISYYIWICPKASAKTKFRLMSVQVVRLVELRDSNCTAEDASVWAKWINPPPCCHKRDVGGGFYFSTYGSMLKLNDLHRFFNASPSKSLLQNDRSTNCSCTLLVWSMKATWTLDEIITL